MLKNLIFWAAYLVPDLFNQKHKPFIFRVLVDTNRLLTQAGHGYGRSEYIHGIKIFELYSQTKIRRILLFHLKGTGNEYVTLATKFFESAVAQDLHLLSEDYWLILKSN